MEERMRLASIRGKDGKAVAAAVVGDDVVDLAIAAPALPAAMPSLLELGPLGVRDIEAAIKSGKGRRSLDTVELLSPVPRPPKFFAIGLNYRDHVAESGLETPEFPTVFAKMPSCVVGPYDDVERPLVSDQLDYEGELGVVIGCRCRHVARDRAQSVVAGYVIINDYSVRDYQRRSSQWILGKSFDTHGVIGPWIVTADELDPHSLDIRTFVNGATRQSSNTSNLIFDCWSQIEELSSVCTLEPGDIVATGTPGGVGVATGDFLVPDDVVRVEIDGIGAIENRIVQEPDRRDRIAPPAVTVSGLHSQ
jgi:2-keto-4-pentenoate hydratase/2-oxohepta-3-ene-1,7-dioic acid hydratase in catechol pathway